MATPRTSREVHVIDASAMTLGRLSTRVAILLRGKQRASFVKHQDTGDAVHVTNFGALMVAPRKLAQRTYRWHTRYPGALKEELFRVRWQRDPERILRDAVYGMLPANRLRKAMLKRLKVTM